MKFEEVLKIKEDIFKDSILTCYRGSHAHNTYIASSDPNSIDDIDIMSVIIPSIDNYFGVSQWGSSGTRDFWVEEWDCVAYEFKKFINLMFKSNPNVLSQLWCRDEDVLQITYEGKLLRENRELFYSGQAFNAFIGYAKSQLDKITRLDKDDVKKFKDLEKRIRAKGYNMDTIMQKNPDDLGEDSNIVSEYQYIKKKYYSGYMGDKRKNLIAKHGYDCYSEDTEFLTEQGWKYFDEVGPNDRLATIKIKSLRTKDCRLFDLDKKPKEKTTYIKDYQIEYQNYINRIDQSYTGDMYHFKGNYTDVLVTANHNMLYRHNSVNTNKVGDVDLQYACFMPNNYDFLNVIVPNTKNYKTTNLIKDKKVEQNNILSLMGWYLSDGTMTFYKGKTKTRAKSVRVSQKKNGKLQHSLSMFYRRYKDAISVSYYENKREPNEFNPNEIIEVFLDIREKGIVDLIYNECGAKENKRIPRWVYSLSKRQKDFLLDGLLRGDGNKKSDSTWVYYSNSKVLADDVQELAISCGYQASLLGPYYSTHNGYDSNSYQVYINKKVRQFKTLNRGNIKVNKVTNKRVVCFTVPNRTLVTRRNGIVGYHGNCKNAQHCIRLLKMGIEYIDTGILNVYRTDDAQEIIDIKTGKWELEDIQKYATQLFEDFRQREKKAYNDLPKYPDKNKVNKLCLEVMEHHFYKDRLKPITLNQARKLNGIAPLEVV